MKRTLLFIFILLSVITGYAQNNQSISWEEYRDKNIGSTKFDYISHGYRGTNSQAKYYCYFKSKDKAVLAYFENMVLVKETRFDNTDLFDIVKQNLPGLRKIRNNYSKYYTTVDLPEKQLGIRYMGLHFNHYGKKDAAFINAINDQKLKDAFTAINLLIETIEKE